MVRCTSFLCHGPTQMLQAMEEPTAYYTALFGQESGDIYCGPTSTVCSRSSVEACICICTLQKGAK